MGSDYPWRFCRFLTTCIGCFREGQTAAPRAGANTTILPGSPGCSSCCIPQQSEPRVSELSFHSSNLGVAQRLPVLPLSTQIDFGANPCVIFCCTGPRDGQEKDQVCRLEDFGSRKHRNTLILFFLIFPPHFSTGYAG